VELIVLNVGLDLGLLSPALFSMMVIMALVTTVITTPLLRVVLPEDYRRTALQVSRVPDVR
jgi:Kef-type K+ transport system membrane component KefB